VIDVAHALLEGDLSRIGAFERSVHHFPAGTVILLDASRSLDGRRVTFEAFVDEHDLRQEILVEARPSAQGVYVELKRFGAPILSRGVREAVHAVTAWLEKQGMRTIQKGK
jgi:tRNA (guanine-N7-)-methyltransferase